MKAIPFKIGWIMESVLPFHPGMPITIPLMPGLVSPPAESGGETGINSLSWNC
jgi:hypothetical protein